MSNLNPTDPHQHLLMFQRALQRPLGDTATERVVSAEVIEVLETTMVLKNTITQNGFELPLEIFRLIPRAGEVLNINRVLHRIAVKEHPHSDRWYQIQVML